MRMLLILCICCLSCAWKPTSVTTSYGTRTTLYTDSQYNYNIKTMALNFKDVEFNLSEHRYEEFNCISVGAKHHLNKQFEYFFIDIGYGFRLIEKNDQNKLLADSYLLADLSGSIGIKKSFKAYNVELAYTLQHLSVPWKDDRGLNYDTLQLNINIPF